MTDRYKGFLITLDKEIRSDDAEPIITAFKMIKHVQIVKPYVKSAEDWMLAEKTIYDIQKNMYDFFQKEICKLH